MEQYIIFKLDDRSFGITVMNIREIITYREATNIPDTPDYIEGIFNHRGDIIPVINLKTRLNLGEFIPDKDSRIIIVTLDGKDIGFLVDEASQNIMIDVNDIEEAPDYIDGINKEYVDNVAKLEGERLLIILDLEKILSNEELEEVKKLKS